MFKLGVDPEFFLICDGKNVSAHGMVDGTKEKPLLLKGGAVQVDGTALEFNTDPARCANEFLDTIDLVLDQIRDLIPKEYEFNFEPVAEYGEDYFSTIPDEAKVLGCDPDYNAYTQLQNKKPDGDVSFRSAAGHLHFGYSEGLSTTCVNNMSDASLLARCADSYLGKMLLLLEGPNKRNTLYGSMGDFRPKSYGCEYRTPSNFWLKSRDLREFVFNQSRKLFDLLCVGDASLSRYINNDYNVRYAGIGAFEAELQNGRYSDEYQDILRKEYTPRVALNV